MSGGSPTNIAVGARRLGLQSGGADGRRGGSGRRFHSEIPQGRRGREPRSFRANPARGPAPSCSGSSRRTSSRSVYYRDNCADNQLTIDDVLQTPIRDCRVFEFSGTGLSKEPSRSATLFAAEQAKAAGATVVLDVDFRPNQWHDARAFGVTVRAALPLVDIVLGTEDECKAVTLTDPAA